MRFIKRWKHTVGAVIIIGGSVTMLFFPQTRTAGEVFLGSLVIAAIVTTTEKL